MRVLDVVVNGVYVVDDADPKRSEVVGQYRVLLARVVRKGVLYPATANLPATMYASGTLVTVEYDLAAVPSWTEEDYWQAVRRTGVLDGIGLEAKRLHPQDEVGRVCECNSRVQRCVAPGR